MAEMHGDVTPKQRKLLAELADLELWLNSRADLPPESQAKMCTCLAHDYYDLGLDEEGERFITRANQAYPGYFKNLVYDQMLADPDFHRLVKQLQAIICTDILNVLGVK